MTQSLGLLLVALQSFRSLKKLKLDFTEFLLLSRALQLNADALMALQCLMLQFEDLLQANAHLRSDVLSRSDSSSGCCLIRHKQVMPSGVPRPACNQVQYYCALIITYCTSLTGL